MPQDCCRSIHPNYLETLLVWCSRRCVHRP
ncbi:hypothetical protein MTR67_035155 [Solanum verrucosum]|uniref:Uncharacterized protein n=1 Tax=Solanum verrucosum TaxID=315347 RepID=A0AAF0U9B9_SOLVR|nr:hypothetical protein MTR67_035155 [Solanum verrucosum]